MALSEAEIQNRRKYIGGSDARTVLEGDAAAWKALRLEKVADVRPEFPERQQLLMDMGTAVEPLILRELNRKVQLLTKELPHFVCPDEPVLAFTPDALTAETRAQLRALVQRLVETGYPRPARARMTAWP